MQAIPMPLEQGHHAGEFQPTGPETYATKRTRVNVGCTIAFCVINFLIFILGIVVFSVESKQPPGPQDFFTYLSNSTSCDVPTFNGAYSAIVAANAAAMAGSSTGSVSTYTEPPRVSMSTAIGATAPISLVVGTGLSILYILLFKHYPRQMVFGSVGFIIMFCAAISILSLIAGSIPAGVIFGIATLVIAGLFWYIRDQLEPCAALLGVAGRGLTENGWLVPAALLVKLTGLGILAFQFAAVVIAFEIGTYLKNSAVVSSVLYTATFPDVGVCYDNMLQQVPCCMYQPTSSGTCYGILGILNIIWTFQVLLQVKLHIIADTIAQWYYIPAGALANGQKPSVKLAARNALTTGFGSAVFAGGVLTVLRVLRAMARSASRQNVICCILNCILQPILAILEKFTKFAAIASAITNKPFVDAARTMFGVLSRNFLQTASVWWVPDMVLGVTCFMFSLGWGILTGAIYKGADGATVSAGQVFLVFLINYAIVHVVLAFVSSMILDIVNTVYICFSMDRDQRVVTRQDIHTIYEQVPTLKGALVQNPGGEVEYGRPDATQPNAYGGAVGMQPLYGNQPSGYSAAAYGAPPVQGTPYSGALAGFGPAHQAPAAGYAPFAQYTPPAQGSYHHTG